MCGFYVFNRTDRPPQLVGGGGGAAPHITWGNMAPEKRGSPADSKKSTNLTGGRISALKKEEIYGAFNHCMTRPQVANGGSELQIWRAAENISNTQS